MDRHHPPHRPEQAQEGPGELQGRDAEARQSGVTSYRRKQTCFPSAGRALRSSGLQGRARTVVALSAAEAPLQTPMRAIPMVSAPRNIATIPVPTKNLSGWFGWDFWDNGVRHFARLCLGKGAA